MTDRHFMQKISQVFSDSDGRLLTFPYGVSVALQTVLFDTVLCSGDAISRGWPIPSAIIVVVATALIRAMIRGLRLPIHFQ